MELSKIQKAAKDFIKRFNWENYERDHSHTHCWKQGKSPACGQSLESHKQCCLCDTPYHHKK